MTSIEVMNYVDELKYGFNGINATLNKVPSWKEVYKQIQQGNHRYKDEALKYVTEQINKEEGEKERQKDEEERQKRREEQQGLGPTGMNALNLTGANTGKAGFETPTTSTPTTSKPTTSTMPTINDTTYDNIDNPISTIDLQSYIDFQMQQREEQWAREDAIRKETQIREDTAWQRSLEDLRKAGGNANLINPGPAASGGGITTASGLDYSLASSALSAGASIQNALINAELQKDLQSLNAELQKYLTEYNGDVQKALEVLKEEHAVELEEIARVHEEELLLIGKNIDQNFDREENKKDRVIDLVGILVALGGSVMNAFK